MYDRRSQRRGFAVSRQAHYKRFRLFEHDGGTVASISFRRQNRTGGPSFAGGTGKGIEQHQHSCSACRMSTENEVQHIMTQSTDPLISRADLLYAKGRCDEAVDLLTDSLARNPSQADVVTRLAEFLIDSGWHARALEFLKNINADENNGRALLLRGLCHEALENFSCAEDIADQLLAQERQRPNALALKARIAVESQENDKAERLFQEAITCDPGCGMAWYGRACLRRQQGDIHAYHTFIKKAFLALPQSKEISIAFHENGTCNRRPSAD